MFQFEIRAAADPLASALAPCLMLSAKQQPPWPTFRECCRRLRRQPFSPPAWTRPRRVALASRYLLKAQSLGATMHFGNDGIGQRYVEWEVAPGTLKRAWVQYKDGDKDWAGTGRYLNVVRVEASKRRTLGRKAKPPTSRSTCPPTRCQTTNSSLRSSTRCALPLGAETRDSACFKPRHHQAAGGGGAAPGCW